MLFRLFQITQRSVMLVEKTERKLGKITVLGHYILGQPFLNLVHLLVQLLKLLPQFRGLPKGLHPHILFNYCLLLEYQGL